MASASDYVRRLGSTMGIALDPSGPAGVHVEGAGALDIYPTEDGSRVLLRSVLSSHAADGKGREAALNLNAQPASLGGAALGLDPDDGLVLVRLVDVRDLAYDGFERAFADFVAVLRDVPALLDGSPDGNAAPERTGRPVAAEDFSAGWIRT